MIIFVIPKQIGSGVIKSQITNFAKELAKYDKVAFLINRYHKKEINISVPDIPFLEYETGQQYYKNLSAATWVYTRDVFSFLRIYSIKKLTSKKFRIFFDFRGLIYAESWFRNKSSIRRNILYRLEKFAFLKADKIGAVSNELKKHVIKEFAKNKEIYVTPCCISEVNIQTKIRGSNEIKFVYVGGLTSWQRFEDIVTLYKSVSEHLYCSLTVITKETEKAEKIISEHKAKNVTVYSRTQNEVLIELPKFDFGFLIRHDTLVNNVASPIKFLEYTSSGVIPIITEGIGDYSQDVKKLNLGIVIPDDRLVLDIAQIEEKINDNSIAQRLLNFSSQYTWKSYVKSHPMAINAR